MPMTLAQRIATSVPNHQETTEINVRHYIKKTYINTISLLAETKGIQKRSATPSHIQFCSDHGPPPATLAGKNPPVEGMHLAVLLY
jgi:hypothetical protein